MKRVLTILALLLLPLSVWAMTPVSDSDLSNVTGQAGVNINADLTMNVRIGTMAWGDEDGLDGVGAWPAWTVTDQGGYVGIKGFNLTNLRIMARETDTFDTYTTAQLKPITIDVAQDSGLYGGRTFVRMGLGSLKISFDALSMTVALEDRSTFATNPATNKLQEEMGSVNVGDIAVYIDPKSYIDIFSHSGQGVNIVMDIELDEVTLGYVSWGDSDGLPAGNTGAGGCYWMAAGATGPGYIGISDFTFGVIKVSGEVIIDVNTTYGGIYAHGIVGSTPGAAPVTVCHIAFGSNGPLGYFNVDVAGPITGIVKLSNAAALDMPGTPLPSSGTLGDIYLPGFGLDITAGSWVDIWAHDSVATPTPPTPPGPTPPPPPSPFLP